ncbi:hypothetical protein PTSG_06688 [Salpingoeca rosetta]|uniref:Poly [ADP-ribose] polymerase n=1 Tax=Salpingoeca rosetta (strain ATCC 50818 / BSB-021) TaxID=946362 RepID=F2UFQ3_SALR5|nr:uncharacterized protein PTSG_06688 [Salpingoeca rosetta]EGD75621.1 hypothetical protein PTSG_06688 [Salpingoeca rosetta]|eukprot:XP_004992078.1 hypothetical protein PTSG_06688 [Salpingoeca rosetta]
MPPRRSRRQAARAAEDASGNDNNDATATAAAEETTQQEQDQQPVKRSKRQSARRKAAEEAAAKKKAAKEEEEARLQKKQAQQAAVKAKKGKKTAASAAGAAKKKGSRRGKRRKQDEEEDDDDDGDDGDDDDEQEEEEEEADDDEQEEEEAAAVEDEAGTAMEEAADAPDTAAAAKTTASASANASKAAKAPAAKRARRTKAEAAEGGKKKVTRKKKEPAAAAATSAGKPKRMTKKQKLMAALAEKAEAIANSVQEVVEEDLDMFVPPHEFELSVPEDKPLVCARREMEVQYEEQLKRDRAAQAANNPNPDMSGSSSAAVAKVQSSISNKDLQAGINMLSSSSLFRSYVDLDDTRVVRTRALSKTVEESTPSFGSGVVFTGPDTIKFDPKAGRSFGVQVAGATAKHGSVARSKRKITVSATDVDKAFAMTEEEALSHFAIGFCGNHHTVAPNTQSTHFVVQGNWWLIKAGGVAQAAAVSTDAYGDDEGFDDTRYAAGGALVCPALSKLKAGDYVEVAAQPHPKEKGVQLIVLRINGQEQTLYDKKPEPEAKAKPALSRKGSKKLTKRKSTRRSLNATATTTTTAAAAAAADKEDKDEETKPIAVPTTQKLYGVIVAPRDTSLALHVHGMSGYHESQASLQLLKEHWQLLQQWGACGPVVAGRLVTKTVAEEDHLLLRFLMDNGRNFLPGRAPDWSADCFSNAEEWAMIGNDAKSLFLIGRAPQYGWADVPDNDIAARTGTGNVSSHTYAHRVGKVGVARGGKEGDSAFIQESNLREYEYHQPYGYGFGMAMLAAARSRDVSDDTLKYVLSGASHQSISTSNLVYAAAEAGNVRTVQQALQALSKDTSSGMTETYMVAADSSLPIKSTLQARSLLKKGGSISAVTPLHVASACTSAARFKKLLQINSLNYSVHDDYARTLLHFAAANEDEGVAEFLLSLGESPVVTDKQLATPLHLAAKHGRPKTAVLLLEAARKRFGAQLTALTGQAEQGDGGEGEEEEEETPAMKRKKAAMLKKLKVAGLAKDKLGLTPLHHAAYEGHVDVLQALHEFDPELDMDLGDRNKRTPLMIAAMQGNVDVMEALVEMGAHVEAQDKRKYTALHHACKNGQFDAVQMLLRAGHNPDARDSSGNTPAHYASAYDWVKVLQLLKRYGADLSSANDWKTTPLSIAVAKSCITCLLYLLQQPGVAIDARDNEGRTLLHHACSQAGPSNLRIVEHLLKQGADACAQDLAGVTPLLLVVRANGTKQKEMVELLLKGGAHPDAASKDGSSPLSVALANSRANLLVAMLSSGHSFGKAQVEASAESFLHKLVGLAKQRDIAELWNLVMQQDDSASVAALLNHRRHSNGRTPLIDLLLAANQHPSSASLFGNAEATSNASSMNSSSRFGYRRRYNAYGSQPSTSTESTAASLHKVVELVAAALKAGCDPNVPVRMLFKEKTEGEGGEQQEVAHTVDSDDDDNYDSDMSASDMDSDEDEDSNDDNDDADKGGAQQQVDGMNGTSGGSSGNGVDVIALNDDDNEEERGGDMDQTADKEDGDEDGEEEDDEGEDGDGQKSGKKQHKKKKKKKNMVVPSHGTELTVAAGDYAKHAKRLGESEKKPFKIEKELDNVLGGCTALHVACRVNNPQPLVDVLLEHGADTNARDRLGQTPLMYAVVAGIPSVVERMLLHGADPAIVSARSGQTALHMAVHQCLQAQAAAKKARAAVLQLLLKHKADTGAMNKFGDLVLCSAVKSTQDRTVADALLKAGADACQLDGHGTAALHYVARMNDLALLQRLLEAGVDPDLRSSKGNTPLHGVIMADGGDRSKVLVQMLLDKGADPNAQNNDGVFPLFRAVTNSATRTYRNFEMEQLLIDRGADVHACTALGRNILHAAVVTEDKPERLDKARTPADPIEIVSDICSLETLDLDVADTYGRTPLHYASLYGAILSARYLIKRGADPNKEDQDGNTALQLALIGHQVNYAALLLDHVRDLKHAIVFTVLQHDKEKDKQVEVVRTTSTFRFLASHHFTGLACVFIDHGVDVLSAFDDCVSVGEYQMAMTLLRKTPSTRVKALRDSENNTLVTFVCRHISQNKLFQDKFCALMMRTLTNEYAFRKDTVNVRGETHLHQACWSGAYPAFDAVVSACDVKATRKDGFDALTLALIGHANAAHRMRMVRMLLKRGADPNYYDTLRACVQDSEWLKDDERVAKFMAKPLLLALLEPCLETLKHHPPPKATSTLLSPRGLGLGRSPNGSRMGGVANAQPLTITGDKAIDEWLTDSFPRTGTVTPQQVRAGTAALLLRSGLSWHHATKQGATLAELLVVQNRKDALERLLALGAVVNNPLDLNHRLPHKGQTVLARCFTHQSNAFAFVNCDDMLDFLLEKGADVNQLDDDGCSPLWHAYAIADTATIARMESKLHATLTPAQKPPRPAHERFTTIDIPGIDVQPQTDATAGLHDIEELLEKKKQEEGKPPGPLVDEATKLTKVARVVKMDDCDDYYDLTMTITDVSYGYWGRHDFYRMQVLHNFVHDMYVLSTRWGRVGEEGMHQVTPYPTKEAAIAEFCKIFKSKSANLWENRHGFEPKPGKYRLQKHDHATIARRQEMAMQVIKFEKVPSSDRLPPSVDVFVRTTADVKTLQRAIVTDCDFDLAFGGAPAGAMEKAVGLIKQLKDLTKKLEGMSWGDEGRDALNTQVQQLTNEFYQTIPINAVKHRVQQLKHKKVLEIEEKLNTISVENVTANLLLGAYHRHHAMSLNPFEYVYLATGARLAAVPADSSTYKAIRMFMNTTREHSSAGGVGIAQVFEISKPDEDAAFKNKFGSDPTRTLLWHGTKNQNVLGILSQGLRCAPPSAQVTGYMFGKGVYFADCFSKSYNYTMNYGEGSELARHHCCMFLAEVVLGNPERRTEAKSEPPAAGYDSIHGLGSSVPSRSMVGLEDDVRIPLGPLKEAPIAGSHLAYNEFILYDSARIRLRYMVLLRDMDWLKQRRKRWLVANKVIPTITDPDPEPNAVLEGDDMWKYYPEQTTV